MGVAPENIPQVKLISQFGDVFVFTEDLPYVGFEVAGLRLQSALSFLENSKAPQQVACPHTRSDWHARVNRFLDVLLESGSSRRNPMAEEPLDLGLEVG